VRVFSSPNKILRADNDVVDGDVDELDEEADEAHDGKADRRCQCDFLVF